MAIYALCSASGSPGVTTTALGMALSWPRPVILLEADPTGGSGILAGYFKGTRDDDGLVELVVSARQGRLAERLPELLVPVVGTHARLLTGSRAHEQSVGLSLVWDDLLAELRTLGATGQDIIVDAGRLGLEGSPSPLIAASDVTLLVLRSSLPAIAAAASWAQSLKKRAGVGHTVGALVVGEGRPYGVREVEAAVQVAAIGSIAWSPRDARVLSEGAPVPAASFWRRLVRRDADQRRFEGAPLARSIAAASESARKQARLVAEALGVVQDGLAIDPLGLHLQEGSRG
jgi:hypothetical protein